MYVQRNTSARPRNICCRGKAARITYSECVFVAFGIQHSRSMCQTVICGLSGSTVLFRIISLTARFSGKSSILSETFLLKTNSARYY